MIFNPSTGDLELIASLSHARCPVARIAAALNISEDAFKVWRARLALGRAWREPVMVPPRPAPVVAKSPRIVAERLFESEDERMRV